MLFGVNQIHFVKIEKWHKPKNGQKCVENFQERYQFHRHFEIKLTTGDI